MTMCLSNVASSNTVASLALHAVLLIRVVELRNARAPNCAIQGLGRHSWEYVQERMTEELAALNTLLAGNAFLTGSSPCQADCFLFATIELVRS